MATENQIQYLNSLITNEIADIDRIGITAYRAASTSYFRAKHPTKEARWDAWDNRDTYDAELLTALREYLICLNPQEMDKAQASQHIDALKDGYWINEVIASLTA